MDGSGVWLLNLQLGTRLRGLCEHGCSPRGSLVQPTVELKHTLWLYKKAIHGSMQLEKTVTKPLGF